ALARLSVLMVATRVLSGRDVAPRGTPLVPQHQDELPFATALCDGERAAGVGLHVRLPGWATYAVCVDFAAGACVFSDCHRSRIARALLVAGSIMPACSGVFAVSSIT